MSPELCCSICGAKAPADLCATCKERRQRASALLAAHPEVGRSNPRVAELRLGAALDALAVVGVEASLDDDDDIEAAMAHLSAVGRSLPFDATGEPWSAVDPRVRGVVAEAVAGWLAERVEMVKPPIAVPPPERLPDGTVGLRACLFCGVGAMELDAFRVLRMGGARQAARALWEPCSASIEALGGRRGQSRVHGHLCPPCARVRENAGSTGAETLRKAAVAAGVTLPGGMTPVAWAVTGDQPGVPWDHLYRAD